MKAVIACGGTGGHLFPGLAVAQRLKELGHESLLLVSEKEIDTQALRAHPEFRHEKLPSIGLPSPLSPAFLGFLRRMWESLSLCREIYRRHEPDIVLAMGGFTSTAPVLAARLAGLPSLVHESNAIPGRANRINARLARKLLLGFEKCRENFPHADIEVTGTPIRENLRQPIAREEALAEFKLDPSRRTLLVMGGSQGAAGINQLLFRAAPALSGRNIQIIHFTGERDDRLAAANYLRENIPAYVAAFHHRMHAAYKAADLVVSRAGAATISELTFFGLPSILIPYPYAAEDHQRLNAQILVDAGAALMTLEKEAEADILAERIKGLLADDKRLEAMGEAARKISHDDAAARIADIMVAMVR